jgi:hypothetical protein
LVDETELLKIEVPLTKNEDPLADAIPCVNIDLLGLILRLPVIAFPPLILHPNNIAHQILPKVQVPGIALKYS